MLEALLSYELSPGRNEAWPVIAQGAILLSAGFGYSGYRKRKSKNVAHSLFVVVVVVSSSSSSTLCSRSLNFWDVSRRKVLRHPACHTDLPKLVSHAVLHQFLQTFLISGEVRN